MVSPRREFDDKVNRLIMMFNSMLKRNLTGVDYKKLIKLQNNVNAEQWKLLYWAYKDDGADIVFKAIVEHALNGVTPVLVRAPLRTTFWWNNAAVRRHNLDCLPLKRNREVFNAELKNTIKTIEETYRTHGERELKRVKFGPLAIKLYEEENIRCLYKIFDNGRNAVIYHIWEGSSTKETKKIRDAAIDAGKGCTRLNVETAIQIVPDGEWMNESQEIQDILYGVMLNESKIFH